MNLSERLEATVSQFEIFPNTATFNYLMGYAVAVRDCGVITPERFHQIRTEALELIRKQSQ